MAEFRKRIGVRVIRSFSRFPELWEPWMPRASFTNNLSRLYETPAPTLANMDIEFLAIIKNGALALTRMKDGDFAVRRRGNRIGFWVRILRGTTKTDFLTGKGKIRKTSKKGTRRLRPSIPLPGTRLFLESFVDDADDLTGRVYSFEGNGGALFLSA